MILIEGKFGGEKLCFIQLNKSDLNSFMEYGGV